MKITTKKIAVIGMLSAVAYVVMVVVHVALIPAAPFLTYDPKDAIIAIGGFLFGPLTAMLISLIVAFLEMLTVSGTGIIGFIMQVIATMAFIFPSSIIYMHNRTRRSAAVGLGIGIIVMTVVMILWNYLLTPLYLGTGRDQVAAMLVPAIIPFNLLKGVLNSLIALFIYKPIVRTLRRTGLLEER